MRVLALVTDAFGGFGGISQFNRDFLHALATVPDVEQIIALPRLVHESVGETPSKLVQARPLPGRIGYAIRALWLMLLGRRYGLIFCGHLFMAPLAACLSRLTRTPLWIQLHGIEAWDRPGVLTRWALRQATLVTTVSRYTRNRVLSWSPIPPHSVRVLPNTVDARFLPGPKPHTLIRRFGLEGKKVLLTVGRLVADERYKGHSMVMQVLPELLKRHPDLVYLIGGDGDDRERLQAMARDLGVERQVTFAGKVPDSELPDLYRVADVFVMPSTREGFGIVFLEAAASGLKVIGGNQDGSVDALADHVIGNCVDPLKAEELIDAISLALKNAGNSAASSVQDHFGLLLYGDHVSRLLRLAQCTNALRAGAT